MWRTNLTGPEELPAGPQQWVCVCAGCREEQGAWLCVDVHVFVCVQVCTHMEGRSSVTFDLSF